MGSFRGHALPGSFFLFFGIWHAVNIYRRYFRWRFEPEGRERYRNFATVKCTRFPLEAVLKLLATGFAILGELYTGFEDGKFTHLHNAQHMTMFAFFFLNGVVDLLVHFKVPALPENLDYLSALLAFAIEGLLFLWHLAGRPPMDIQVHTFLIYVVGMTMVTIILEVKYPHDFRPALARSSFVIIQGVWFWTVGQILYPKFGQPWKEDSHGQMMLVTMTFALEIGAGFIFTFLLGVLIYRLEKRRSGVKVLPVLNTNDGLDSARLNNGRKYKRLSQSDNNVLALLSDDEETLS